MINKYLSELLDYAVEHNMIESVDEIYVVNRVLNLIGGDSFEREEYQKHVNIEEILSGILDFANEKGKLEMNTTTYRDILAADIMDVFTPIPSVLYNKYFETPDTEMDEATVCGVSSGAFVQPLATPIKRKIGENIENINTTSLTINDV